MNIVQCLHDKTQGSASRPAAFSVGWSQAIFVMSLRRFIQLQASLLFQSSLYETLFLQKSYISTCFSPPQDIRRGFLLLWKKGKSKNSAQCLFCRSSGYPSKERTTAQLLSWDYTQHPSIKLPSLWTESVSMSHLSVFHASISKIWPKVTASSLCTTLVYRRFHRNAVLSDSGGKLYNEIAMKWNHLWYGDMIFLSYQ